MNQVHITYTYIKLLDAVLYMNITMTNHVNECISHMTSVHFVFGEGLLDLGFMLEFGYTAIMTHFSKSRAQQYMIL